MKVGDLVRINEKIKKYLKLYSFSHTPETKKEDIEKLINNKEVGVIRKIEIRVNAYENEKIYTVAFDVEDIYINIIELYRNEIIKNSRFNIE